MSHHFDIGSRAMLVNVSIRQWTARRYDKAATDTVHTSYGATNAGRFNKALVASDELKAVNQAATAARTFHYAQTLPWGNDGARILPAANFPHYSGEMRKFHAEFDRTVAAFIAAYPNLVAKARRELNGLFNPADYPSVDQLREKFGYSVGIDPIPTAGDFRVDLADEATAAIRADIESRLEATLSEAHADLYKRLAEAIGHIAERLKEPDAIFRDSLIGNLAELTELLPRLDLRGDPVLCRLRKEAERKLLAHEPQTLRDDKETRAEVARDAAAILDAMEGMFN